MSEVQLFFNMGGYAAYVWSAYGLTFFVLLANLLLARHAHRKTLATLARSERHGKLHQSSSVQNSLQQPGRPVSQKGGYGHSSEHVDTSATGSPDTSAGSGADRRADK